MQSKDHGLAYVHFARAYCIGLKLDGVTPDNLRAQTQYIPVDSTGLAQGPSAIALVPSTHIMVGGGARANYTGPGILLYTNTGLGFPGGGGEWYANGRDHIWADFGSVTAFAIAIPRQPTGYSGTLTADTLQFGGSPSGTGYQGLTASEVFPFAMTSVGGETFTTGAGRLLTDVYPTVGGNARGGVQVWSKDHVFPGSGRSDGRVIGIRKQ
ncbi:MAG TPA: hypothetical protein VK550_03780 [Polyangiaceae bacterium]|nr:hypothetical protein [Polyangiaceae bacterium]